jgi:hypothetical protein
MMQETNLFREQVLLIRNKRDVNRAVAEIEKNASLLGVLMEMISTCRRQEAGKPAWVFGHIGESCPEEACKYLPEMLFVLQQKNTHDAVKRNIIRVLSFIHVPENLLSACLEICYAFFLNRKEAVAIRTFSMSAIERMIGKSPELQDEFYATLELELSFPVKAAFRSRAQKILNKRYRIIRQ